MLLIRPAEAPDVPVILRLIRALAEYERAPDAVTATEADLLRDGFGDRQHFHVVLAEWDGAAVGFAFYFFNYSTWEGRPGLYLEDLFVEPAFRGWGIGKALLVHLARIAVEKGCGRYQWQVLDWNEPAIRFYESMGGQILREWSTVRVKGEDLERLAGAEVDGAPAGCALSRPLTVVYDGDCGVCTRLAHVLQRLDTRGTFEVLTSQAPGVHARFPSIPPDAYRESLQLVEDGRAPAGSGGGRADPRPAAAGPLDHLGFFFAFRATVGRALLPLVRAEPLPAGLRRPLPVPTARRERVAFLVGAPHRHAARSPPPVDGRPRGDAPAQPAHHQLCRPFLDLPRLRLVESVTSVWTPAGARPPEKADDALHDAPPVQVLQKLADDGHQRGVHDVRAPGVDARSRSAPARRARGSRRSAGRPAGDPPGSRRRCGRGVTSSTRMAIVPRMGRSPRRSAPSSGS